MIIILDEDDFPYVFKKHNYPEQSPVDVRTKYAKKRYLPFIHYTGHYAFSQVTVDIVNNGHTGIKNLMLFDVPSIDLSCCCLIQ